MTNKQRSICAIAAFFAGLLATAASAQSSQAPGQKTGYYIGASLGAANHALKGADFGSIGNVKPSLDKSDRAVKIFGGYSFNPHLAVEMQYMDFGSATVKYALPAGAAKEEYTVHAMSVAAVGKMPVSNDLSVFAKVGIAAATAKNSVNAAALGATRTAKRTVLLAGVGAAYQVTDQVQLRAEYERLGEVGKAGAPGRATPSALTIGVGYRF